MVYSFLFIKTIVSCLQPAFLGIIEYMPNYLHFLASKPGDAHVTLLFHNPISPSSIPICTMKDLLMAILAIILTPKAR